MNSLLSLLTSLIAGLAAAFTVHFLTRSREHESWVRDRRLGEWRELLDVIARSATTIALNDEQGRQQAGEEVDMTAYIGAMADVATALNNRLFISNEVTDLDLKSKWRNACDKLGETGDFPEFFRQVSDIKILIVEGAIPGYKRRR